MLSLRLERREVTPKIELFATIVAILLAFLIAAFIFLIYGINPLYAYAQIFGTVFKVHRLGEIVTKLIPLLLCGVGLTIAFKANTWNIGAEGQLLIGAILATWVALFLNVPEFTRLPLMFLLGFIGGTAWAFIPAILKSKLRTNEVITTLMMNYIAANLVNHLIYGPWKGAEEWGFPYTNKFPTSAWLPTIPKTRIHWPTLIIALMSAFLLYFLLTKTTVGFELRVAGQDERVARYAGMSVGKAIILAMIISGGLAGIAGVGEVAGVHHRLRYASSISSGYGYAGIIVALLARNNPILSILTAFFLAILFVGGDAIQVSMGLPFGVVNIFNGIILACLLTSEFLAKYKISWR